MYFLNNLTTKTQISTKVDIRSLLILHLILFKVVKITKILKLISKRELLIKSILNRQIFNLSNKSSLRVIGDQFLRISLPLLNIMKTQHRSSRKMMNSKLSKRNKRRRSSIISSKIQMCNNITTKTRSKLKARNPCNRISKTSKRTLKESHKEKQK
jgi:hypothetical protein